MKKFLLLTPVALIATFSLALASCGSDSDSGDEGSGEELTLKLGSILPESGELAFLGPPMINAVELAVQEINDADSNITIDFTPGDSGTSPAIAGNAADGHIADDVDAILGAAASGISLSIIDKIIAQQIVMISPSNTSPTFTTYADNNYYFRTAPSDVLQAQLLAERVIEEGGTSVTILHRSDDYGRQLADRTMDALQNAGAEAEVIEYDSEGSSFEAEAQRAAATAPDGVIIIGFAEGAKVIKALIESNLGPADVSFFVTDGLGSANLGELVDPSNLAIVAGIQGTEPSAIPTGGESTFESRFRAFAPDVDDLIFSAHTYDATVILALAALTAESTDPTVFSREINDVTRGGTKCTFFEECADLIADGVNIDYDGASGGLDFADNGEPSTGSYDTFTYDAEGVKGGTGQVVLQ